MAEQNGTPQSPDSVITTQRDGQTIVAELFFNHSGTETFRDKLLKVILADSLQDGQEPDPQYRLEEAACRLCRAAPRCVPPDRRRPGNGLHGV